MFASFALNSFDNSLLLDDTRMIPLKGFFAVVAFFDDPVEQIQSGPTSKAPGMTATAASVAVAQPQ